ncbi:MAG: restriction endonuclease subunit S, partial [Peptostreptococcaceae bacterium]
VINKVYLAYYLNSDVCQKYILERKMSVGVPKLAIFRIENLPLILPPMELQNEFEDFVKQVDKLKFEMNISLR